MAEHLARAYHSVRAKLLRCVRRPLHIQRRGHNSRVYITFDVSCCSGSAGPLRKVSGAAYYAKNLAEHRALESYILILQDYAIGRFEANMPKRAKQLRKILGGLGPSFVKVGQALSARPDLMSPVYLLELGQLQDQLPPFPTTIAMALMEEELGRKVRQPVVREYGSASKSIAIFYPPCRNPRALGTALAKRRSL